MKATKTHAEIQRAYRLRMKQQNPELLRMFEREKWRRQCLKKELQLAHENASSDDSLQSRTMATKYQDNMSRHVSELQPVDVNKYNDKLSLIKYPIHDLLRWLENVEAEDTVKYRFLKYLYNEQDALPECRNGGIDAYNSFIHQKTDASQRERYSTQDLQRRRDINDRKRMSVESLAPASGVLSKHRHHENAERIVTPRCRKSDKKIRDKTSKKTTKRENRSEQVKWEPLHFNNDDSDKSDERSTWTDSSSV